MHIPRHVPVGAQERDVQQTPSFPLSHFSINASRLVRKNCDMQQYEPLSLIMTLQMRPRVGSHKCDVQQMHSSCTRNPARLVSKIATCNSNIIGNATLWHPIRVRRNCDSSSIYLVVECGIRGDVRLTRNNSFI